MEDPDRAESRKGKTSHSSRRPGCRARSSAPFADPSGRATSESHRTFAWICAKRYGLLVLANNGPFPQMTAVGLQS